VPVFSLTNDAKLDKKINLFSKVLPLTWKRERAECKKRRLAPCLFHGKGDVVAECTPPHLEALMDDIKDYLLCDNCKNKNFLRIYNFAVHYKKVNFSDDVIYDEVAEELYQCTHCQKIFTKHQINTHLKEMADERLRSFFS
jgi:hypothetical protein